MSNIVPVNDQLPSFMTQDSHLDGTELLQQFISPPRLKVIQKMSGKPFSDMFNPGDVVAMPMTVRVAPIMLNDMGRPTDKGASFHFVPVFFYPEWVVWNPLDTRGTLPAIRQRTQDGKSDIAIKSRSQSTWSFACPEKPDKECRIVEHLNFIVVILPPNELAGIPAVMTFARAEHRCGSNFAALLKMRKAAIYGCVFAGKVSLRENAKGNWFGIDVTNPDGNVIKPFVQDEETYRVLQTHHNDLNKAYKANQLTAEYDEEVTVDSSTVAASSAEF